MLSDLQNDSEEDCYTEKDLNAELPFQDDSHFKKFEIRFRNKESKDDVKSILSNLEKDTLLLDLIPIAFNEDMEGEIQTFNLSLKRRIRSISSGIYPHVI